MLPFTDSSAIARSQVQRTLASLMKRPQDAPLFPSLLFFFAVTRLFL
eukprot:SAG31_NODE_25094_length_468_cov_0.747967_1_plen_46_part_01